MPRYAETYTTCAGPDSAYPHQRIGGIAGLIIRLWYATNGIITAAVILTVVLSTFAAGPVGIVVVIYGIIDGLREFKRWYYHHRLLCVGADECAIGTTIAQPGLSFDGDRKFNIALAPFPIDEV